MKLGVAINFFNGGEHLPHSIRSIRAEVDCVVAVYQKSSNYNSPIKEEDMNSLLMSSREGLIDVLYEYKPNLNISAAQNEIKKRNIGLQIVKKKRCSHFFNMDADEFYRSLELKRAKEFIISNRVDCSAVRSYWHLKKPIYRSKHCDVTNVPFICKINFFSKNLFNSFFPIPNVDPTRRLYKKGRFYFFHQEEVSMYHMNLVRKDFDSKFKNSSTDHNKAKDFFNQLDASLKTWKYGEKFYFPNKGLCDIQKVENEFFTYGE